MWQPGIWRVVESPGGPAAPVSHAPAKSHRSAVWHVSHLGSHGPTNSSFVRVALAGCCSPLQEGPEPHTVFHCSASFFFGCRCLLIRRIKTTRTTDTEVTAVSPPENNPCPSDCTLLSFGFLAHGCDHADQQCRQHQSLARIKDSLWAHAVSQEGWILACTEGLCWVGLQKQNGKSNTVKLLVELCGVFFPPLFFNTGILLAWKDPSHVSSRQGLVGVVILMMNQIKLCCHSLRNLCLFLASF